MTCEETRYSLPHFALQIEHVCILQSTRSSFYVAVVKRRILTLHEFHVYTSSLLTVSIHMLNNISAYQTFAYNNNNIMFWIVVLIKKDDGWICA